MSRNTTSSGGTKLHISPTDPRLGYEIRFLELTARGLRACRRLGVRTIQDFLERDRRDFTRLPNCGGRTFDDLAQHVREFLAAQPRPAATTDDGRLERPLHGLIRNPRAERAFRSLGITTVGEFLETPKESLLSIRGFGERTYWQIAQRVRQVVEAQVNRYALLPDCLLEHELQALGLDPKLLLAFRRLGAESVGDALELSDGLLRTDSSVGLTGVTQLRNALDKLLRVGIDRTIHVLDEEEGVNFESILERMSTILEPEQIAMLHNRVGLGGPPHTLPEIAGLLNLRPAQARLLEEQTRVAIRDQAPSFAALLHREAQREFRARQGMIRSNRYPRGTILSEAAEYSSDPQTALRLVRFLFAGEFFLYGDLLSTLHPSAFRQLQTDVRRICRSANLPLPLDDALDRLRSIVDPVPVGLVQHLIGATRKLRIKDHCKFGRVIDRVGHGIVDRIERILADSDQPRTLEDISFKYQDDHRAGNMKQLLDHLRKESIFVQVGRATWNLRSRHEKELVAAQPEAENIIKMMEASGARQNLLALPSNDGIPERRIYMVIDCLRRDPRVRYLGRGVFCAQSAKSAVMEDIRESMHRAMGEIVISRFLDNQPRQRRRLAECLLHHNRALIETGPDRIDALSNYPFNAERLQRLLDVVDRELASGRGYAHAKDLLAVLKETDLGGAWLTEHMLRDLLRRHSAFELLPCGILAQRDMRLAGWIQHRARECLRRGGEPMSPVQILAESPDLASFEECLAELIKQDPMVQSADGDRYTII